MALEVSQLLGKARSFIETIERMPPNQKMTKATAIYAADFNNLLAMAQELVPDLDPRLWPKPFRVGSETEYVYVIDSNYGEIETFVRQIETHLKTIVPTRSGTITSAISGKEAKEALEKRRRDR